MTPRFQGANWRRNRDRLDAYLKLAKTWGVKPATLAIAWTLARAPHIVPIPGTRTAAHLEDCAAAADIATNPVLHDALQGEDRRSGRGALGPYEDL